MTPCNVEIIHEATTESSIWRTFTDSDSPKNKMKISDLVAAIAQKATPDSALWSVWAKLNLIDLVSSGKVNEAWELLLDAARATVPGLVESIENS